MSDQNPWQTGWNDLTPKEEICERLPRIDDGLPFFALGYDNWSHFFMRRDTRIIISVSRGNFSGSKAIEIAPYSFWLTYGETYIKKSGDIKIVQVYDYLVSLSVQAGIFNPGVIRGAGVWREQNEIIINDGEMLHLSNGTSCRYNDYQSEFVYVKSTVKFSKMSGASATAEDGKKLQNLFSAYNWANPAIATLAMGWALIAPFGGILKWRPHIWITGRKGTGKTCLINNVVQPLSGNFAHKGSGKDTEAGTRRVLNQDARPAFLEEMEPKNIRARDKISSLLELARNSSSDGSGLITIANGADGRTMTYVIRSCFAFASVQIPDEDAAISSRIIKMELEEEKNQQKMFEKIDALHAGCMDDPAKYTRRIYEKLPQILSDIEWIKKELAYAVKGAREIEQLAPLLAAACAVQFENSIEQDDTIKIWVMNWFNDYLAESHVEETVNDEDEAVRHLLSAQIRNDQNETRTLAEIILNADSGGDMSEADSLLSRHGIRLLYNNGIKVLAFSSTSQHIQKMLAGTSYESGYKAQLMRNATCVEKHKVIRFKTGLSRACLLDWAKFKSLYFEGACE